ncbi:CCR4-NOT transcription complex subunit 1-like [Hyperolius riggenbachi]|uniref:CCR4-NOT transcription complex subunit 1-like n=1 Tax=Hyperolius riggenbachi TaxID=752182 RepID=UPI0035A2D51B
MAHFTQEEKYFLLPEPPMNVQMEVAAIFNSLSSTDINQKVEQLKKMMKEEFMPWVCRHLVLKCVSIHMGLHVYYCIFLDALKNTEFNKMVLAETYSNIKVLLASDKVPTKLCERSALRNLGKWLGMITLAKCKPILLKDLDMKLLLIDAYAKGQEELLYVVPFVTKVMESASCSIVFWPPNPWTMGILNVLAELHGERDVDPQLKFQIEHLCGFLSIKISDLQPSSLLKKREPLKSADEKLSEPKKDVKQPTKISNITSVKAWPSYTAGKLQTSGEEQETNALFIATDTTPALTTNCEAMVPPQPQYDYCDIHVNSFSEVTAHITINPTIPLFQTYPHLKQYVHQAFERAVQELVHPVVERSIKIAMATCENIICKDFALDSEESRMQVSTHHMMRNLTAAMAMVICREPLLMRIATNLKNSFAKSSLDASPQQRELMEQAANQVAQDNYELACCFIQKMAMEKAGPEMDKRLAVEYELRKHARQEGRRYCDPFVLTYQAERMPEQIRLKFGGEDPKRLAVYEEYGRNIPGFLPTSDSAHASGFLIPNEACSSDDVAQIYDKCIVVIEKNMRINPPVSPVSAQTDVMRSVLELVAVIRDANTAMKLLQKAVECVLDATSFASGDKLVRYWVYHLLVLKVLQNSKTLTFNWCNKQITRCLIECQAKYKYNVEPVELLIWNNMVNMQQYDVYLAGFMESGTNYMAVEFAMQLVKFFLWDTRDVDPANETMFLQTIKTLLHINANFTGLLPKELPQLISALPSSIQTMIKRDQGGTDYIASSDLSRSSEHSKNSGFQKKAIHLLKLWFALYLSGTVERDSSKAFSGFVRQMHQDGLLKTDELITQFFRLGVEMCVKISYRVQAREQHSPPENNAATQGKVFHILDGFVRLVALLVKQCGEATNIVMKINLLNKVLESIVRALLNDHQTHRREFQQRPYHRILVMLMMELDAPEPVLEAMSFQTFTVICNALHSLRPVRAAGFVYAWMELISHRVFIGGMLERSPQQKGWPMYAQLLIDLFTYLAPFLQNVELTKPMQVLYMGTLRVLLVLLHDFPEFLCDYYYGFCDVIPLHCIQLRNLILSAHPHSMKIPDPLHPDLQMDKLSEVNITPRILTDFTRVMPPHFKRHLDSYLKTRSPVTFLPDLRGNLQICDEPGKRYSIQLMNALVIYVGTLHNHNKGSTPSMSTVTHSAYMDVFQYLLVDLDTEGRYIFLNAITNQLRYPNSHTHYFCCIMLHLFTVANTEAIREQIARVLLERLIANRPHPWGVIVTFVELIRNPTFNFWNHQFVRCAPEIERLFQTALQYCMGHRQAKQ